MPLPAIGFAFLTSTTFITFLKFLLFSIVIQFLVGLGVAIIVFTGFDLAISSMQTEITTRLASINPTFPDVYNMVLKAGFLDAINIIFTTMATVISIKTITGALKTIRLGT